MVCNSNRSVYKTTHPLISNFFQTKYHEFKSRNFFLFLISFTDNMDDYPQFWTPVDTIPSGHLTLAVYPMFIVIGQIFFEATYFYPADSYLKIYIDNFSDFVDLYLKIANLLLNETIHCNKRTLTFINSWEIVKDCENYVCLLTNDKNYQIKLDLFQLNNIYIKFQQIIFKPLCLPNMHSHHLHKFAIFLSKNLNLYPREQLNQISFETIDFVENIIIDLYLNQNFDRVYFLDLIIRYKKIILLHLDLDSASVDVNASVDVDSSSPQSVSSVTCI